LHAQLRDGGLKKTAAALRRKNESAPLVLLAPNAGARKIKADHYVSSHDAQELLELMRDLLGDPRKIDTKEK
jgi:hypothetical protein